MKAFLVGLSFLVAAGLFAGIWVLLLPILLALGLFLRVCLVFVFVIFAVWLLGKLIIFLWGRLKG